MKRRSLLLLLISLFSEFTAIRANNEPCPPEISNYAPPTVDVTFFGDAFSVKVESHFLSQASDTIISLSESTASSVCQYPGPAWTHDISCQSTTLDTSRFITDCKDQWEGMMDWEDASQCNWVETNPGGIEGFSGTVVVHQTHFYNCYGNSTVAQEVEYVYPVRIVIDTDITVATSVVVRSGVDVFQAISKQTYNPVVNVGEIGLTIGLRWPFKVAYFQLLSFPEGMQAVAFEAPSTTCNSALGSDCVQVMQLSLFPTDGCTLSGLFNVTFGIDCRFEGNCPLAEKDKIGNLELTVTSENFCEAAEIDVKLAGNLTIFEDTDIPYTNQQGNFLMDEKVILRADLDAMGVELVKATILEVFIVAPSGSTVFLYSLEGGGPTLGGTSLGFELVAEESNWASFSFVPTYPTIYIPADQKNDFTIGCKLEATYAGMTEKRTITRSSAMDSRGRRIEMPYTVRVEQVRQFGTRSSTCASEALVGLTGSHDQPVPTDDPLTFAPNYDDENGASNLLGASVWTRHRWSIMCGALKIIKSVRSFVRV